MPMELNPGQVRILHTLLTGQSIMKGGDLARESGVTDLGELAQNINPLVIEGLVEASGSAMGDDIFYAVFAIRPSKMTTVAERVRRASPA
jgi:hypothetical protein